jgi:hypothetical protein
MFRITVDVDVDGSIKTLLVVGNAHPSFEDGSLIAVLNPDESLLSRIMPGCAYSRSLKEIVRGKCDVMLYMWVDAFRKDKVHYTDEYIARKPSPAKFTAHSPAIVRVQETSGGTMEPTPIHIWDSHALLDILQPETVNGLKDAGASPAIPPRKSSLQRNDTGWKGTLSRWGSGHIARLGAFMRKLRPV